MRHITAAAAIICAALPSCNEPEPPVRPAPENVAVESFGIVELIEQLAHPDADTRGDAVQKLERYLVGETGAPEYPDRLTQFHKHAPHACRAGNETQTLHILTLFAAQGDISSILVKQCLQSPHSRVRSAALDVAHFSDNPVDASLLAFEPDPETLDSYRSALRRLRTPDAIERLANFDDRD